MKITTRLKIVLIAFMGFNASIVLAQSVNQKSVTIPNIDYKSLISKADLNYTQPVQRTEAGQPIGNGRMGSLIWTNQQAINLQINRVDYFNVNASSTTFDGTPRDYCGGVGFVDIDFQSNEALFTQPNFNQHLSCYDGTVQTDGKGIQTNAFVWNDHDVMVLKVHDTRAFQTPSVVNLRTLRAPIVQRAKHKSISKISILGDKLILTQESSERDY